METMAVYNQIVVPEVKDHVKQNTKLSLCCVSELWMKLNVSWKLGVNIGEKVKQTPSTNK